MLHWKQPKNVKEAVSISILVGLLRFLPLFSIGKHTTYTGNSDWPLTRAWDQQSEHCHYRGAAALTAWRRANQAVAYNCCFCSCCSRGEGELPLFAAELEVQHRKAEGCTGRAPGACEGLRWFLWLCMNVLRALYPNSCLFDPAVVPADWEAFLVLCGTALVIGYRLMQLKGPSEPPQVY